MAPQKERTLDGGLLGWPYLLEASGRELQITPCSEQAQEQRRK